MTRKQEAKIYQSSRHLFVTFLFVAIPFVFFLLFANIVHIASPVLFKDVFVSLYRMAIAYVIAAILGWLLAVAFYRGRRALVALPIFDVLQSFPAFAALPLVTFFLGPSNFTVIAFLTLAIIWPIFFSIISSLKLLRKDFHEVVEIFGVSGFDYVRRFLIPVSMPALITGSIIGLGDGWEILVATEIIVGVKSGLGGFFQLFSRNPAISAFGIFGFLLLIFTINRLVWLPLLEWSHRKMEE